MSSVEGVDNLRMQVKTLHKMLEETAKILGFHYLEGVGAFTRAEDPAKAPSMQETMIALLQDLKEIGGHISQLNEHLLEMQTTLGT